MDGPKSGILDRMTIYVSSVPKLWLSFKLCFFGISLWEVKDRQTERKKETKKERKRKKDRQRRLTSF